MKILAEDSTSRELLSMQEDNDEHSTGEANVVAGYVDAPEQAQSIQN